MIFGFHPLIANELVVVTVDQTTLTSPRIAINASGQAVVTWAACSNIACDDLQTINASILGKSPRTAVAISMPIPCTGRRGVGGEVGVFFGRVIISISMSSSPVR